MKIYLSAALRAFQEENKSLPKRIIFYRDGVGDGQIEIVKMMEVKMIEQQLLETYAQNGLPLPEFCFIIVNKRINTRFFLQIKKILISELLLIIQ